MKLSTIPDADVGETDALIQNPKTIPLRRVVAASAAVSFLLGLVAATAVTSRAVATQQTMFNGVPGCDDNFNTYGKDYDYCGGGDPSDPQQISCTPYPVRRINDPYNTNDGQGAWCKWNEDQFGTDYKSGDWYGKFSAGKDSAPPEKKGGFAYGAYAWADPNSWGKDKCSKNYWVIHGCDYSGIQTDCAGQDGFYIEHFGPWTSECDPNEQREGRGTTHDWIHPTTTLNVNEPYAKDACVSNQCCDEDYDNPADGNCKGTRWSDHQKTFFVHPGNGYAYATYESGWWQPDAWSDCNEQTIPGGGEKPWCRNMVDGGPIPDDTEGFANPNCMFAMVYPWVCTDTKGAVDMSVYWGDSDIWPKGMPYGDATQYVMCYADNEPWDKGTTDGSDIHDKSDAPPPVWKALKMCLRDDGKLEMWTMYEKKAEWKTGKYVGAEKNSHHVLEGQSDGGTAYGGKGKFPY